MQKQMLNALFCRCCKSTHLVVIVIVVVLVLVGVGDDVADDVEGENGEGEKVVGVEPELSFPTRTVET